MKALILALNFCLLSFFCSSIYLFGAEISLVTSLPSISISSSPCAAISYKNYLYCHTDEILYIFSDENKHEQQSFAPSKSPKLVILDNDLTLAFLTEGIVLLLDIKDKKAIKIFGGTNNGSPRDTPPEPVSIGDFKFSFKKSLVLEVVIEYQQSIWELVRISSRSKLKESLSFSGKTFSVVSRSKLRIADEFSFLDIEIGQGLQPPLVISEEKKILAMALRTENNIVFFDTKNNKIICKVKVGSLAQQGALLGNILFVPSFGERLIYRYDLTALIESVSL